MKLQTIRKAFLLLAAACFAWRAWRASGQDIATATPPLSYGAAEVLKLEQAKVGEDIIISFINNSGCSYGLNAAQIIYLRQQGVSAAVLSVMLTQHNAASVSDVAQATPLPQPPYASDADTSIIPAPVTYVNTPPTYYYPQNNYYPYYGYSWGWPYNPTWSWTWYGGGWHWGWNNGWHGGYWSGGAWHGNTGWGWNNGWHGGSIWSGGAWHGGTTWNGGVWHAGTTGGWHSGGASGWHGGGSGGGSWHSGGGGGHH